MVSSSTETLPDLHNDQNLKTDFMNCEIEHVIQDDKAHGYEPGNLAFVLNQKILISCSPYGRVIAWTISDDSTDIVEEFRVYEAIRCCKTVDLDESTTLLLLGGNSDILIYEIKKRKFSFKQKLACGFQVRDLEVNINQQKLYVAKSDYHIQVYNLLDFLLEEEIDVWKYGFTNLGFAIDRVIYMKKENALAVDETDGLFIVSLDKGHALLNSFRCPSRKETGICYLPKSDKFLLRTENLGISILDAKTLTVIASCKNLLCGDGAPFRFIANEDESQIIGNLNYVNFAVFQPDLLRYSRFYLSNHITKSGAIEVLKGQSRFAVGDLKSGTIVILKSNATGTDLIKPSHGLFVAEKSIKKSENKQSESGKAEKTVKAEKVSKTKDLFKKPQQKAVNSKSKVSKKKPVNPSSKKLEKSQEIQENNNSEKPKRGRRKISEDRKEKKQQNNSKERSKEKPTKKARQKSETKKQMQH